MFQIKGRDPLVVTSLGFFKPLGPQDAARLLTTVVGLSELPRFKRLYAHGGLVGGGSYSRGTIWRRKLKLTLVCSGGEGDWWLSVETRGAHLTAKKFAFSCSEQNTLASHLLP